MIAASWLPANHNKFAAFHVWNVYDELYIGNSKALCGQRIPDDISVPVYESLEMVSDEGFCKKCFAKLQGLRH